MLAGVDPLADRVGAVLDRESPAAADRRRAVGARLRYLAVAKVEDWQSLTWLDEQDGIVVLERWDDLVVFRVV